MPRRSGNVLSIDFARSIGDRSIAGTLGGTAPKCDGLRRTHVAQWSSQSSLCLSSRVDSTGTSRIGRMA